jgi:hypothetical protein
MNETAIKAVGIGFILLVSSFYYIGYYAVNLYYESKDKLIAKHTELIRGSHLRLFCTMGGDYYAITNPQMLEDFRRSLPELRKNVDETYAEEGGFT